MKKTRSLIVTHGQSNPKLAIAFKGTPPWYMPGQEKLFSEITRKISSENPAGIPGVPVIIGQRLYESLPEKSKPLIGRTNIIVRETAYWTPERDDDSIRVTNSIWEALNYAEQAPGDELFCIGGEHLYKEMLEAVIFQRLFFFCVCGNFPGDEFFPMDSLDLEHRYKKEKREVFYEKDTENHYPFVVNQYILK